MNTKRNPITRFYKYAKVRSLENTAMSQRFHVVLQVGFQQFGIGLGTSRSSANFIRRMLAKALKAIVDAEGK